MGPITSKIYDTLFDSTEKLKTRFRADFNRINEDTLRRVANQVKLCVNHIIRNKVRDISKTAYTSKQLYTLLLICVKKNFKTRPIFSRDKQVHFKHFQRNQYNSHLRI